MSRLRPIIIVLVLVAVAALAWRVWPRGHGPETLSGYVEGETLYLSAAASGTVSTVAAPPGVSAPSALRSWLTWFCTTPRTFAGG